MPLPNFHACRIKDPEGMDDYLTLKVGPRGLQILVARPDGKGDRIKQSYRYPKKQWTESEAREHCGKRGGTFEPSAD